MLQRLWLPGPMPGFNELIAAAKQHGTKTSKWNGYAAMKRAAEQIVVLRARTDKFQGFGAAHFTYLFHEPHRRRDPSNVMAAGIKIVEDALRHGGFMANDGWRQVLGIRAHWVVSPKRPGVTVFVSDEETLGLSRAMELDLEMRK